MKLLVLLTCFNRKEKTKQCLNSLVDGNPMVDFTFVIVDDNSNDGTIDMLEKLQKKYKIYIIKGNGSLFYSGGMRVAMDFAIEKFRGIYDYFLMVNDDVEFFDKSIEKMLNQVYANKLVIVGATCDKNKKLTYGAIKYLNTNSIKYNKVDITKFDLECDTFNANCVLIPYTALEEIGSIDSKYVHTLGDFDYGLMLKNSGFIIKTTKQFVGICENNAVEETWLDKRLSIKKRINLKGNIKGLPMKHWFYFLKKNFGLTIATFHSLTPYIKIILKR